MANQTKSAVFDYRALRLLVGLIALALPIVVSILSSKPLSSISASYHTEGRDAFVGMLFIVSSFLWAYNGHSAREAWASKIAALAALFVAMFPTSCDFCKSNTISKIHYYAAAILFIILAYFCFIPFRKNTKGKKGKKGLRSKIYFICGSVMIGCMFCMLIAKLALSDKTMKMFRITYWAEAIALGAFGFAWIVAGKYLRFLVDDDEALRLFRK
jgi:hypothetical protein